MAGKSLRRYNTEIVGLNTAQNVDICPDLSALLLHVSRGFSLYRFTDHAILRYVQKIHCFPELFINRNRLEDLMCER